MVLFDLKQIWFRIRTGIYPTNLETLTIDNTSSMDVEALFCFLNEVEPAKAAFFLEPTEMILKPGESKVKLNDLFPSFVFIIPMLRYSKSWLIHHVKVTSKIHSFVVSKKILSRLFINYHVMAAHRTCKSNHHPSISVKFYSTGKFRSFSRK